MTSTTITVSNSTELYAALGTCKGGETILMEGGDYGSLVLSPYTKPPVNVDFPSTVTIASADPSDPAVFSQVNLTGMSNLTFEDVTFDYTFKPTDPSWYTPFNFSDCDGLTIKDCTFDGDEAHGLTAADNGYPYATGLQVRGSDDVTIEGNEFYDFIVGLTVSDGSDTVVQGNEIYSIRKDGMEFAEVTGIVIDDNYIHDFKGSPTSGDHCDMIQFWTSGTDSPSTDIIIKDNVLDIGNGTATQSIFMRNEMVDQGQASFASMAYRNVAIVGNTITNAQTNGIVVGEAIGVTISQNTLVHADGGNVDGADSSVEIPRISVAVTSTGVTVTNNITSSISGWTSQPTWVVKNNAFVQDQDSHAPGYYADVFVGSSLQPGADGSHHFIALTGAMIDLLDAGSVATQPQAQGFQVQFHVEETNSATRVFDASASVLNGADLPTGTTYLWDFGDGTTAKGETVSHSYADGGDYKTTLTVTLPNGTKTVQSVAVPVESPDVLSMDSSGHFTAYEDGHPIALGAGKTATAEGIQLGATGTVASVARSHVVDVVGANDMTIAFSLDADKAGTSGELFRLHGSFIVAVTKTGELQVQIMHDGAPTTTLVTKGAGLNTTVNQHHDIVINLDDGQLQIWVDGKLDGQMAMTGTVGGATGFNSQYLAFGNPWGQANFNGDLSAFELSVGAGDYPAKPETHVVTSTLAQSPDDSPADEPAPSHPPHHGDGHTHHSGGHHSTDGHAHLSQAMDDLPEGVHDRFAEMLQARLDAFAI